MMHDDNGHGRFTFNACFNPATLYYELYLRQGDEYAAQPIEMVKHDLSIVSALPIEPLIKLSHQESQGLFESFWEAGLRPTVNIPIDGIVEAKKAGEVCG